jgi:uncharacterized membrane protein YebE (DUF533 family)
VAIRAHAGRFKQQQQQQQQRQRHNSSSSTDVKHTAAAAAAAVAALVVVFRKKASKLHKAVTASDSSSCFACFVLLSRQRAVAVWSLLRLVSA